MKITFCPKCYNMKIACRDPSMQTVTRKFAKLYLTRKLNDDLETYEREQLSRDIKVSSLIQQYNSTQLTYTTSN